jgi:hypothetical protein
VIRIIRIMILLVVLLMIAEHPVLTYDDGPEGVMTVDRWRDLIKQVRL